MASITLITGVMAAGKSTVSQALAERMPNSVHVRGDLFRRMIVNGEAPISNELSPEAVRQLHLRYRLGAATALAYDAAGFNVVYQDILVGKDLTMVVDILGSRLSQLVVLNPSIAAVHQREHTRTKTGYHDDLTVQALWNEFSTTTPRIGLWIDTSNLDVAETVERIIAEIARGASS